MAAVSSLSPPPPAAVPAGSGARRLAWLTPAVCRLLLAFVLAFGFFGHLYYLHVDCPIDLSGDEAQYWDWSRQLDLSYYSKGPLVAYIIRASCAVFGDTMPAVRYPAVLLATLTSLVTYLLALKLFRSDRVALASVLLYHAVPMFVAGSVLMTIDPPFFFCWALATYLLALAVFDGRRWAWPAIGVVAGVGFLAKYAMFLWFVPMLLFLALDRPSRPLLRTRWPWVAVGVACLFTTQVIVWNARHDWVSFKHVTTQTGTNAGARFSVANLPEFVGGQVAVVGPALFVVMVAAAVWAFRRRREPSGSAAGTPSASPYPRQAFFLALVGTTFFAFTLVTALRAKVQMNWPAPAYFTLLILSAHFLGTRWADRRKWRAWRPWVWATVAFGLVAMPIAHDPAVLYPVLHWVNPRLAELKQAWADKPGVRQWAASQIPDDGLSARQVDFSAKLKGWQELGSRVSDELDRLGPGAFVLCHDYQQSAEMAFYLRGQPKTYYAGSYYQDDPGRMTQFDVWPDRSLEPGSGLMGKNAIFLGHHPKPFADLLNAFERVEGVTVAKPRLVDGQWVTRPEQRPVVVEVVRDGTEVREFRYFRCYGFKGMTRPAPEKASH